MTAAMPVSGSCIEESLLDLAQRLSQLLSDAREQSDEGRLANDVQERVADIAEAIRRRTTKRPEGDPRSLFDLDERFIDLMDRADDEAASGGELSKELLIEITEYLEAFRHKVDRIAGYWRWQEAIAQICGDEADRLAARKKAADGRVNRLKNMLLAFMTSRDQKKLEGEKASITKQQNSTPALVVDDPLQIDAGYFEVQMRLTKPDVQEIVSGLAQSELRQRLEFVLRSDGWELNTSAVRAALLNNVSITGARLVKGHHVRIR